MKKFTLISVPFCAVVLGILLALTPGPVQAGAPPSDRVVVDFPTAPDIDILVPETAETIISIFGPVPFSPFVVVFLEPPGLPNQGQISDLLWVSNNTDNIPGCPPGGFMCFVSDDDPSFLGTLLDTLLGGGHASNPRLETGLLDDVTADLYATGAPGFTVSVQSDVETVPEPSTILLLGSGLAGLAYWRRRQA
jgi:hypothetical protein